MNKTHSLEHERQSILSRMQTSREQYRRMLMDDSDLHTHNQSLHGSHLNGSGSPGAAYTGGTAGMHSAAGHEGAAPQYSNHYQSQSATPADMALAWAKQHPLLCAAAVAAVVAIGPRRLMRTVGSALASGGALTALTLRNPSNIDAITRLKSTVRGYLQQGSVQKNTDRTRYRP